MSSGMEKIIEGNPCKQFIVRDLYRSKEFISRDEDKIFPEYLALPVDQEKLWMLQQFKDNILWLRDRARRVSGECGVSEEKYLGTELIKYLGNEQSNNFDYKKAAESLWQILDDIDTSIDIFKPVLENPRSLYRFYKKTIEYIAKRHDILKSDGYNIFTPEEFENLPNRYPQRGGGGGKFNKVDN